MKNEELIQNYIQGTLSPEDKLLFDNLRASDREFREEISQIDQLKPVITSIENDQLIKQFQDIEKEHFSGKKKSWNKTVVILIGAFFLICSIILLFYVFKEEKPIDNRALFAQYYETPVNTYLPVTRSSTSMDLVEKAFTAYEQENFEKASITFESLADSIKNDQIIFYQAISYAEDDNYAKAIDLLDDIESEDSYLAEDKLWYLTLFSVKMGDIFQAQKYFSELEKISKNPKRLKIKESLIQKPK